MIPSSHSDQKEEPIRFAGTELPEDRHICAFFNTPDEEYRVLLSFIVEGLERGEKAVHVVDPDLREYHLRRLASAGLDVTTLMKSGQLETQSLPAASQLTKGKDVSSWQRFTNRRRITHQSLHRR